ncbi:MAG TPA: HNH endonuclease signature motif containing protein, partial [Streptosporangiaceae bacterium]
TPAQASYLALLAAADPAVDWRVVVTDNAGRAIAVTRVRPGRSPCRPARAGPGQPSSLLRRVTVIVGPDDLSAEAGSGQRADNDGGQRADSNGGQRADNNIGRRAGNDGGQGAGNNIAAVLTAIITAAQKAAGQAAERTAADAAAGGCAHTQASLAYEVPVRLREIVNLRDLTCRFPTCRQPAWRCDADHTQPYDQGGPTCLCNLGPLCRYHHQMKQHPLWRLEQPAPGSFIWTTPAGRTYAAQPDPQAA